MPERQTVQTAVLAIVVCWTLVVVAQQAATSGRWLVTLGQAATLFAVTAALAWAGATTDNLIDEVLGRGGRGRDGEDDQPGGPRAWRIHVPVDDQPRPRHRR